MNFQVVFAQISTPTDISNLIFWVDAQDVNGTGVQPGDGSAVTTWVNKAASGSNLTTTAGTVTFQTLGFDGVNPGLRFPEDSRMLANNPFPTTSTNVATIFFVNNNVTATRNFALSLNGTSTNGANRFSFHAPWNDNEIFFDAGSTGTARLRGDNPNTQTETTLYTGLTEHTPDPLIADSQLLRVDGKAFRSDTTGQTATVSGGIHLGTIRNNRPFDGRFAEVLIYNRALTLTEIQDVECFLLLKWKPPATPPEPSVLPAGCAVDISANKTVETFLNTGTFNYSLPGADLIYTITVTHESGPSVDSETIFLVDTLPDEIIFYNDDIDDAGPETTPVIFSTTASGLSFDYPTDIAFSNGTTKPSDMSECNYTPVVGYDPNVRFICIMPTGIFNSGTPNPSFDISFRAQIK